MRIFSNRQNNTTNTQVPNTRIESGWGVIVPGASAIATTTVTFQTSFTTLPIVVVTYGGDNASLLTYGSGSTLITAAAFTAAIGITAASFTPRIRTFDGNPWSAGNTVFYQWIAIGL